METALYVLLAALLIGIVLTLLAPIIIYTKLLVRTSKDKWTRNCSINDDDEQVAMYDGGEAWMRKYSADKKDVDIVSDGYHLYGEYIDFGYDKAVIIISGRTEACRYGYYFAEPYRVARYNVLVIDNRSHGLSDGKYNCLGIKEYRDIIAWADMLHNKYCVKHIICHGICIGSATALAALTSSDCPEYLEGMVADGMYVDFIESFKNHLIERNKPVFPTAQLMRLLIDLHCGKDIVKNGPLNTIGRLNKPILFLYSKQDAYSVPEKGQILFNACNAPKKLVWFEKGAHSRLRINNSDKYDNTVTEFLNTAFTE